MSKQTEALQEAKKALKRLHASVFHEHGEEEIKDDLDNAYSTIAMIESALSDDGWVSVEKENIEMKKLLNEMLQMKVCWKKNPTKNMWNRALAFIKDFKQTSKI